MSRTVASGLETDSLGVFRYGSLQTWTSGLGDGLLGSDEWWMIAREPDA
jgi:hypothetical protein